MPLIAAGVIAAVASPVVAWLKRHGVPRVFGAVLLLLALVARRRARRPGDRRGHIQRVRQHQQPHLLGRDDGPGLAEGPGDRPEERELCDERRAQRDELDRPGAAARRHRRRGEAVVAGVLPRADAAQPGVPAQGRADDPRMGRASRGRARRGRAHGQRPDPAVAARLLLRGHDRGRVQRGGGRRRGADPRHPAGGDDRRGDVRRRLHPLPRRLDRGRVRRAARARRRGRGGGAGDDRDPAARQRRPAAARPADRLRRRAGHPPAGGARGHDRRRRAVRRRGPDPRRADDVGGQPDRRRPAGTAPEPATPMPGAAAPAPAG